MKKICVIIFCIFIITPPINKVFASALIPVNSNTTIPDPNEVKSAIAAFKNLPRS